MTIKMIGAIVVIISTTLLGFYYGAKPKRQVNMLLEIKKAFYILRGEISFSHTEFPEALQTISRRVSEPLATVFRQISEALSTKKFESFADVWTSAFKKAELELEDEDVEAVISFGQTHLDIQMQLSNIELITNHIDMRVEQLSKKSDASIRMYRSLGLLSGLLICVLVF